MTDVAERPAPADEPRAGEHVAEVADRFVHLMRTFGPV